MIKKLKKQLFNSPRFLFVLSFFALVGFFVFATYHHRSFYYFLAGTLALNLISLVAFQLMYIRKRAECIWFSEEYAEKINVLEAQINEEKQVIASLHQKIVGYSHLKDLAEELSMSFSLKDVTKIIFSEITKMFGAEDISVALYLFQSKTGELGVAFSRTGMLEDNILDRNGDIFDQWVVKNMKPLLIEDTHKDFRFDMSRIEPPSSRVIRSLMSVPLVTGHKSIGILRLDTLKENQFKMEEIRLLTILGDLSAVAIENALLYERVEYLATHDSLTGLYLRRFFLDILQQEINKSTYRKKEVAFIMLDLDHFKDYNDTFGHSAGDLVIREVGQILKGIFFVPGDLICRYGGEEFLVFLTNRSPQEAVSLAEQLRKKIEDKTFVLRRRKMNITASLGVVAAKQDAYTYDDVKDLIGKADSAMLKAKKKGRNNVVSG